MPTDKAAIDDALYALAKQRKRVSVAKSAMWLNSAKELIAAGADLDQMDRPRGPLLAVILGSYMTDDREALFRTILEAGANPNAPVSGLSTFVAEQEVRYTSLAQVAVSEGIIPMTCCRLITLLAQHGADLNAKTRNGFTALDIAMSRLWEWEDRFEMRKVTGTGGPYSFEILHASTLVFHAPPFLRLVEIVIEQGGLPSLWTKAQVKNCHERMGRILEGCRGIRQEGFAKAKAAGMESEIYFETTKLENHAKSVARMVVGEPTLPLVLPSRKAPKSR